MEVSQNDPPPKLGTYHVLHRLRVTRARPEKARSGIRIEDHAIDDPNTLRSYGFGHPAVESTGRRK
jgi:hypothetical protein